MVCQFTSLRRSADTRIRYSIPCKSESLTAMADPDEQNDEILPPTPEDLERRRALQQRVLEARERRATERLGSSTPIEESVPMSTASSASDGQRPKRKPVNQDPWRDNPNWQGDLTAVQIRLPADLLKAIRHIAVDENVTVSQVLARCCYGSYRIRNTWVHQRSQERSTDWERDAA